MSRWQPDAVGRLQRAALQRFDERGYDRTTVAEIAERAGLTERTFFRHFADKREVLFRGSEVMRERLLETTAAAPEGTAPLDTVVGAVASLDAIFSEDRRSFSRARAAIIEANPELQERELAKRAGNVGALTEALCARGEPREVAQIAAEAGMAILHVAFVRWVRAGDTRPYAWHVERALDDLRAVCRPGSVAGLDGPRRVA